jgi:uncharacterized glyoxalase superfamily protein PhnB
MDARLFAYLSYRDAPAALAWMRGLGFQVITRQDDANGHVVHAELRLGEAVVMIASFDADYVRPSLVGVSTGQGIYLRVDDVDAFFSAAIAGGGKSVIEPEDTGWGARRARVLDPEGVEWSFGTYEPGLTQ